MPSLHELARRLRDKYPASQEAVDLARAVLAMPVTEVGTCGECPCLIAGGIESDDLCGCVPTVDTFEVTHSLAFGEPPPDDCPIRAKGGAVVVRVRP